MSDRPDDTQEPTDDEPTQAMRAFTEPTEPDVHLDRDHPAFDKVQGEKTVDDEYEAEYNRRYVKEHGDHHGNDPAPQG